jgi:N-methylhydantoinase A
MLVAFGGAGPAHACRLATEAAIPRVLIPLNPGTASALGLLVTDVRLESSATLIKRADEVTPAELQRHMDSLQQAGLEQYEEAGLAGTEPVFETAVEMRYYGQSFELTIPAPKGRLSAQWLEKLVTDFHTAHEQAYGFKVPGEPVELVNLRLTTVGRIARPKMRRLELMGDDPAPACKGERPVYFAERGGFTGTPVYDRAKLPAGCALEGPAIIEEKDSTTVLHPGWTARVDDFGNLFLNTLASGG